MSVLMTISFTALAGIGAVAEYAAQIIAGEDLSHQSRVLIAQTGLGKERGDEGLHRFEGHADAVFGGGIASLF